MPTPLTRPRTRFSSVRKPTCRSQTRPRDQSEPTAKPVLAMTKEQLSLKNFMSAYFHEDWMLDAKSTHEVVSRFVRDQETSGLKDVVHALRGMLTRGDDDATLSKRLFSEFGAYFDPRGSGESTSGWLDSLANQIESAIKTRE